MEAIRTIVGRLPQRELEIRRRCLRDPSFRSICADYEEAAKALGYWQQKATEQVGSHGRRNIEDYSNLLTELEAEIIDHLDIRRSAQDADR